MGSTRRSDKWDWSDAMLFRRAELLLQYVQKQKKFKYFNHAKKQADW